MAILGVDPVDRGLQPPQRVVIGCRARVVGIRRVDDFQREPQLLQARAADHSTVDAVYTLRRRWRSGVGSRPHSAQRLP
jgi:hypothetical protein